MTELALGKLIFGELPARDAVHVAVLPVIATEELTVGQRIEFVDVEKRTVRASKDSGIGIVDPFLVSYQPKVYKDDKFFMWLYPGTITALRHDWTHPVVDPHTKTHVDESREWIRQFAASMFQTYERLMDDAKNYSAYGDYAYDNSERYKEIPYGNWKVFWQHYKIVTGESPLEDDTCPYTCSC